MRLPLLSPRRLFACCLLLLSMAPAALLAQDSPDQAMLERLFGDHEDRESIEAALKQAADMKLPQQVMDEALFLYHIRSETEGELARHVDRFEKGLASYRAEDAIITRSADEWRALVHFCRAMDASNKSDIGRFKKHITEAFWLNPDNGEIFAAPIQQMRAREAMAKLVVDFKIELLDTDGNKTSLEPLVNGRKGILIDFWASWCSPCMALMPELRNKAKLLGEHGIAVVGLNTEADPATAAAVKKSQKIDLPWLVEPESEPYSSLFRVDSIPRMVLISPDGKVLYNGHPSDPKLWDALRKIAPELQQPKE